MNILLVTPRFPYPTRTGDTLTVYHLLKHLSQRHAVDLVSCTTEPLPAAYRDAIRPFCRTLRTVPVSPARSFINGAGAVLRRRPLQAAWFYSPAVSAAVDELAAGCDYDVLYAHTVRAARYLTEMTRAPQAVRVLAMQISMRLNYERLAQYERNPIYGLAFKHEAARLGAFERDLLERFDRSLVISDVDRAAISPEPDSRFFECPHGVTLDAEPIPAGLVQGGLADLVQELAHHRPHPHDFGRVLDRLVDQILLDHLGRIPRDAHHLRLDRFSEILRLSSHWSGLYASRRLTVGPLTHLTTA